MLVDSVQMPLFRRIRIPINRKMAIVLCDIQGHSYEEAAKILGISVATLTVRLCRGREQFKKRLHIEYDMDKDGDR